MTTKQSLTVSPQHLWTHLFFFHCLRCNSQWPLWCCREIRL